MCVQLVSLSAWFLEQLRAVRATRLVRPGRSGAPKFQVQDTKGGKITATGENVNFSHAEESEEERASARRQLLARRIARVKEAASEGAREEEREAAGASERETDDGHAAPFDTRVAGLALRL